MVRKKQVTVLPFHSYFNIGQGNSFYWRGKNQFPITNSSLKGYDSLKDYDLPYQDKSAKPELGGNDVEAVVSTAEAWIGGSSMKLTCIKNSEKYGLYKLLTLNIPSDKGFAVSLKIKQTTDKHKYSLKYLYNKT